MHIAKYLDIPISLRYSSGSHGIRVELESQFIAALAGIYVHYTKEMELLT